MSGVPRICVIDNSAVVRETITIILADEADVVALSVAEYLRHPVTPDADLFIVGDDLPAASARALGQSRPILWLQGEQTPLHHVTAWSTIIRRSFHPEEIRSDVRRLLRQGPPAPDGRAAGPIIDYPVFSNEATVLARRAAATDLPVLICGEPGTGKARLGRAIHALGKGGRFVAFAAASCTEAAIQQVAHIAPGALTVFIDEINNLAADVQQVLLGLLDTGGVFSDHGWHSIRLICATRLSFEAFRSTSALDTDLFYRLSIFPVRLLPLRERAGDIPALAQHVATQVARSLSLEPATFTPRAIDRLARYYWFGNLAELETVLTRTLALTDHRPLDVGDLLFGFGRLLPQAAGGAAIPTPRRSEGATSPEAAVGLIINELAHEFKNPMVTIKTIAQHLEHLLDDQTGREQVARLTGEAVDRMDRALENLLQFTRFRAPSPTDITLNALLAPCLTDLTPTLAERRVLLNYRPPDPLPVFVDAAQVGYAFENLLRAIIRDLPEGKTLSVRPVAAETVGVTFEFPSPGHPVGSKLATLLDQEADEATLPLGLVFAKSLIERNGGRIDIGNDAGITAVTVWLPCNEVIAPENGKITGLNS